MEHRQSVEPGRFLNVDLELLSREPLDPLAADLGDEVIVLYGGPREHHMYFASFELAKGKDDADCIIREFCRLLTGLNEQARGVWQRAHARSFNLGFDSGEGPRLEMTIRAETVRRVAELKAELAITIYPPTPPHESGG